MTKWPSPCRDRAHAATGQHVVTARHCNYSAFNGYHRTPSAYSEVRCQVTGWRWRTKGAYVDDLPNASATDFFR